MDGSDVLHLGNMHWFAASPMSDYHVFIALSTASFPTDLSDHCKCCIVQRGDSIISSKQCRENTRNARLAIVSMLIDPSTWEMYSSISLFELVNEVLNLVHTYSNARRPTKVDWVKMKNEVSNIANPFYWNHRWGIRRAERGPLHHIYVHT